MFLILIYFTFYFILFLFNDYLQTAHITVLKIRFFFLLFYYLYVIYFLRGQSGPRNQLGRINFRTGWLKLPVIRDWTSYVRHDVNPRPDKKKSVRNTYDSKFAQCTVLYFALDISTHGCEFSVVAKRWQRLHLLSSRDDFSQSIVYYFLKLLKKIISKIINKYIILITYKIVKLYFWEIRYSNI